MPHCVKKGKVEYVVGDAFHLKEDVTMGIPHAHIIVIAELLDPATTENFIGADLEGIEERCYFAPEDLLENQDDVCL